IQNIFLLIKIHDLFPDLKIRKNQMYFLHRKRILEQTVKNTVLINLWSLSVLNGRPFLKNLFNDRECGTVTVTGSFLKQFNDNRKVFDSADDVRHSLGR